MQIKSKEAFIEEEVTDLDIGFASGQIKGFVLREADSFVDFILIMGDETIIFNEAHIAWYSMRKRKERKRPTSTPASPETAL